MGIDNNAYMIVGCDYRDLPHEFTERFNGIDEWCPEGIRVWAEENELIICSHYFGCNIEDTSIGFNITRIEAVNIEECVYKIKELSQQFKELTGATAYLFATQDIT